MQGLHDIKHRIKSIRSTKQVTKAMEAVSASKMRRAVEDVTKARGYAVNMAELSSRLRSQDIFHPLLEHRLAKKSVGILLTSDKGLCGGMNSSVSSIFLREILAREEKGQICECIALGKKGAMILRRNQKNVIELFEGLNGRRAFQRIRALSRSMIKKFQTKEIDEVFVGFMDFQSSVRQTPKIIRLIPLGLDSLSVHSQDNVDHFPHGLASMIFEPSPLQVLGSLLPRLVDVELWQCFLETTASEHSARMISMRNATENAETMMDELTLTYHQARQSAITQEIAEIAAGRAALTSFS